MSQNQGLDFARVDIPYPLHTQVANTKESVFVTCNKLQVLHGSQYFHVVKMLG